MITQHTHAGGKSVLGYVLSLSILASLDLSAVTFLTFQVDMTAQANIGRFSLGTGQVNVQAYFTDRIYPIPLTNDPAAPNPLLFTGTLRDIHHAPGTTFSYTFVFDPGNVWESPASTGGSNRTASLPAIDGSRLVLPIVYFDDLPSGVPLVTNEVIFQVDMSAQVPGLSLDGPLHLQVSCLGSFNRWNEFRLTNDLSASNTNIYRGAFTIVGQPQAREAYKFQSELAGPMRYWRDIDITPEPLGSAGAHRSFELLTHSGPLVLPVVFFGDLQPNDMLPASTVVHFSVDMTGAVGADGHAFDSTVDTVFVNGDFVHWTYCDVEDGGSLVGWAPWNSCELSGGPPSYRLTNVLGTSICSAAIPISTPNALALTYRYTINGPDNEPTGGTNHLRYVRQTGEYTLPLDTFGAPYQERSFGDLRAMRSDPEHLAISWLGRPGIRLQSCASLTDTSWVNHPETDGLSSTNWPAAGGQRFFRLTKP